MGKENAILAWQFKHAHCMWGQNASIAFDLKSTLSMGNEDAIPAWQFKHAHFMWGQYAILALWP